MNEMIKGNASTKRVFGYIACLIACLALVLSFVPAQAIAASKEVPLPEDKVELVYTGDAQIAVAANEGYELTYTAGTTSSPDEDDEGNIVVTDCGEYKVTAELKQDYTWPGGGPNDINITITVTPADFAKDVEITIPTQTYTGKALTPSIKATFGDTVLKENTDYVIKGYDNNTNEGTATVFVEGMGNFKGSQFAKFEITNTQVVYRLYNPYTGQHLYTIDSNEYEELGKLGWNQENEAWKSPLKSEKPIYRLYNPNSGDHHYTMDANEYKELGEIGWEQEGVKLYSDEAETTPVFRLFNPNETIGTHHYTLDKNERDTLVGYGWKDEGTAWYAK